jgi:arsenate reductase
MKYLIYGMKNDDQITKLLDVLEQCEIEFDFFDYRETPPTNEQLIKWAEFEGEDLPINTRSTFFKKNTKEFNKLTEIQKFDWLRKNHLLIHRPIIEDEEGNVLSVGGRPERIAKTVFNIED